LISSSGADMDQRNLFDDTSSLTHPVRPNGPEVPSLLQSQGRRILISPVQLSRILFTDLSDTALSAIANNREFVQ
jgi:hypothetical protein